MSPTQIKTLREAMQMNQEEFARLLGFKHRSQISHWEAGTKIPDGTAVLALQLLAEKHLPKKARKTK